MDILWGNMAQYTKIVWGWEIAVYLFVAGLSAGALIAAVLVKWRNKNAEADAFTKAGALMAFPAISIGLLLLIVDLGKPLSFWVLMIYFNLKSVMSIGVMLLSVYSALSFIFALSVFKKELKASSLTSWAYSMIEFVVNIYERMGRLMDWLLLVLAVCIAAYTGFLLSVLVAKPLMNNSALPLLFLVSGISSGIAASIIVGSNLFKKSLSQNHLKYLAGIDAKLVPIEIVILFAMFVGMFNMGGKYAVVAGQALTCGVWAGVFWCGIIGIGLLLPLCISGTLHRYESSDEAVVPHNRLMINCLCVLTGVILLRFYILYAGQTFLG